VIKFCLRIKETVRGTIMKKAIFVFILIVIAFLAYNYFRTGTFTLIPSGASSEEERELKELEEDLKDASALISQAERSAGISGMDTTADMDAALQQIKRVERGLEELKERAGAEELKDQIGRLEDEIRLIKNRYR
jgi:Na+/phosphate symporter